MLWRQRWTFTWLRGPMVSLGGFDAARCRGCMTYDKLILGLAFYEVLEPCHFKSEKEGSGVPHRPCNVGAAAAAPTSGTG